MLEIKLGKKNYENKSTTGKKIQELFAKMILQKKKIRR